MCWVPARFKLGRACEDHSPTIIEGNQRTMTTVLKWMAWIGLVWINSAFAPNLLAESKPEKIYRKVLPSVMTLEVENFAGERFVGSAVLALADDIAITAWHVVSDARSVSAIFADGERIKVTGCIDSDGRRDLALVKLEKSLPGRQAVLCQSLQGVATRAYVIGAPKGYGFSISDGLVSQIRSVDGFQQYQVSCPISPGNSGGPLLNDRGQVIGIASWTKSDAQNINFAIPIREVADLNPAGQMTKWEQLALTRRPLAPRTVSASAVSGTVGATSAAGGFEDLAKRLEKSRGKQVTVVVQEEGQESKFTFTVPHPH
jgi:S1-C subfamily serine protease